MAEIILRLTRHPADEVQIHALRRVFGDDCKIVEVSETVPNAERVKELVREHDATVLEAVLPIPLLQAVLNPCNGVDVPVIRAVMERELRDGEEAIFRFKQYERVLRIEIVSKPIE